MTELTLQETAKQRGMRWLKESIALFKTRPHFWMLTSLVYIFIFMVLPSLPKLGFMGLLTVIIWPFSMAFIVLLFRQADLKQSPSPVQVYAKLLPSLKTLALLGLSCLVYAVLTTFFLGSDLAELVAHAPTKAGMSESQMTKFMESTLAFIVKVMLLLLPLFVTTWFSPMLIGLNGYPMLKAVKSSLAGMLQYAWPMSLSWLLLTLGMIALMLGLGLVVGILGALIPTLAQILMPLLIFVVLLMTNAIMFAFQYISYKDVFKAAPVV